MDRAHHRTALIAHKDWKKGSTTEDTVRFRAINGAHGKVMLSVTSVRRPCSPW